MMHPVINSTLAEIHRNELVEEALRNSRNVKEIPSPAHLQRRLVVSLAAAAPVILLVIWLALSI
jgi:hypothetical protein